MEPIPTTPPTSPRVTVRVQTIAGYLGAAAAALTPLVAYMASLPMPEGVQVTLLVISGALAAITGKNRSDQAVALTAMQVGPNHYAVPTERPADLGDAGNIANDGGPLIPEATP